MRFSCINRRSTLLWLSSASTLVIAGCAAPKPGPNIAASQAQAPETVPLAHDPAVTTQVAALVDNKVSVDFPPGSAAISSEAERQLDLSARLFRDAHALVMFVSGHADASGQEYGNLLLSARRAQAAKTALTARGIPADRMVIRAYGVAKPVDATDPNGPANRQVVITWHLL